MDRHAMFSVGYRLLLNIFNNIQWNAANRIISNIHIFSCLTLLIENIHSITYLFVWLFFTWIAFWRKCSFDSWLIFLFSVITSGSTCFCCPYHVLWIMAFVWDSDHLKLQPMITFVSWVTSLVVFGQNK